ncbi:MAG: hypothetical protein IKJ85_07425 [Firmicutes bacterium]|nr:hypothetical protein [Bacillota bacterium]
MAKRNDRIKYYGQNDLATYHYLNHLSSFLEETDFNQPISDINTAIEWNNVTKLLNLNIKPDNLTETSYTALQKHAKLFPRSIGRFLQTINDDNLLEVFETVDILYKSDFFELFNNYKLSKRITGVAFSSFMHEIGSYISTILQYKDISSSYNEEITNYMRSDCSCAEFLLDFHLSCRSSNKKITYYLPDNLTPDIQIQIVNDYIDSEKCNPNYLQLLSTAKSSPAFPVSNELRYKAYKMNETICEKLIPPESGFYYGGEVTFGNCADVEMDSSNPTMPKYTYSKTWLEENLDYPTILNNLIYLFGFVDSKMNSTFVSRKSDLSIVESTLGIKGKTEYIHGIAFSQKNIISLLQTAAYVRELSLHDINLESVIAWFFKDYLPLEFNANGFYFSPSSKGTTYREQCRNLLIEMDSVLKQFNMFVSSRGINRELFEFASEPIVFSQIKSFNEQKYGYLNDKEVSDVIFALFSDQSTIHFVEKIGSKYPNFLQMVLHENLKVTDFEEYQIPAINTLINNEYLYLNENGYIKPNIEKAVILRDIYYDEVIRIDCYKSNTYLNTLIEEQKVVTSGTLFSKPEQDYLDYMLNMHKYSNGLDLRNKYCHGNNPIDEKVSESNYYQILKIMCLIIIKINDEFCKYC